MNARKLTNGFDVKVIAAGLFAPQEKSGRKSYGVLVTKQGAVEVHNVPAAELVKDANARQIERFVDVVSAISPQYRAWLTMRIRREIHGNIAKPVAAVPARKPVAKQTSNVRVMAQPVERVISLAFKAGTSDKVYEIVMTPGNGGRFQVTARYGRRGGTLQTDRKGSLGEVNALALVEQLASAKLAKGYRVASTNFPRVKAVA